jgi:hypothetical protein
MQVFAYFAFLSASCLIILRMWVTFPLLFQVRHLTVVLSVTHYGNAKESSSRSPSPFGLAILLPLFIVCSYFFRVLIRDPRICWVLMFIVRHGHISSTHVLKLLYDRPHSEWQNRYPLVIHHRYRAPFSYAIRRISLETSQSDGRHLASHVHAGKGFQSCSDTFHRETRYWP